jgi:hypothetical protein
MNRAFSPEILVKESWAVGPGWNETGLWPYVTTVSKYDQTRVWSLAILRLCRVAATERSPRFSAGLVGVEESVA